MQHSSLDSISHADSMAQSSMNHLTCNQAARLGVFALNVCIVHIQTLLVAIALLACVARACQAARRCVLVREIIVWCSIAIFAQISTQTCDASILQPSHPG